MSCLEDNAAYIINLFFQNNMFHILDLFISLLEQTYDDASQKHSTATKLEELWQ